MIRSCTLATLAFTAAAAPLTAQSPSYMWRENLSAQPPARVDMGLTDAPGLGGIILTGGYDYTAGVQYTDTMLYAGGVWTTLNTPVGYGSRDYHSAAYDKARNRLLVFGGWDATGAIMFDDQSEFDGTTWTTPAQAPGVRPGAGTGSKMVYIDSLQRIMHFGGYDWNTGVGYNQILLWDGSTWTDPLPTGVPPSPRDSFAMGYDPVNNAVVLYGGWDAFGTTLDETWVYDVTANSWSQKAAGAVTYPGFRTFVDMAYDPASGLMIVAGGYDSGAGVNLADTWGYDVATDTWTQLNARPDIPSRDSHRMTTDSASGNVVLFGGFDGAFADVNNTFEFGPLAPVADNFGSGCPGVLGVPTIGLATPPQINTPLILQVGNLQPGAVVFLGVGTQKDNYAGSPLPLALGPATGLPLPGCDLLVAPDQQRLLFEAGGIAADVIPNIPAAALGLEAYAQAGVLQPAGNPARFAMTDGLRVIVGP